MGLDSGLTYQGNTSADGTKSIICCLTPDLIFTMSLDIGFDTISTALECANLSVWKPSSRSWNLRPADRIVAPPIIPGMLSPLWNCMGQAPGSNHGWASFNAFRGSFWGLSKAFVNEKRLYFIHWKFQGYSQTWLLRTGLYRNSYLFGIASPTLQIFAGYIGKSCYKPLRNDIVIFFGVFRYNEIIVFGRKSCRFVRFWGPLLCPFLHQNSVLPQDRALRIVWYLLLFDARVLLLVSRKTAFLRRINSVLSSADGGLINPWENESIRTQFDGLKRSLVASFLLL
jgi:hypothetical protein